jgi:hypothetical protein
LLSLLLKIRLFGGCSGFRKLGTEVGLAIAEALIKVLFESDLKTILQDENEDNVMADLGVEDYIDEVESEPQSKGIFHCSAFDSSWSPHGMYGGYDDWEIYLDANGID